MKAPLTVAIAAAVAMSVFATATSAQQKTTKSATPQKTQSDVTVDRVEVDENLDETKVLSAIKKNLKTVRACYARELKTQPALRGSMDFRVLLNGKGQVVSATVESTSLRNDETARCARAHAMALRVKVPPRSGYSTIRYELRFVATGPGGGACDRIAQCCASREVQSINELQPVCRALDQWRQLPQDTMESVCTTALSGIQAALETLLGNLPADCQ
jgi:hypothetical protein